MVKFMTSGEPGSFVRFAVPAHGLSLQDIGKVLTSAGWKRVDAETFSRGSRLWMRFWGANFTNYRKWPFVARVEGPSPDQLEVKVVDNMGPVWHEVDPNPGPTEQVDIENWGSVKRFASGVDALSSGASKLQRDIEASLSAVRTE